MSLTVAGTWAVGVWATTVWADGVWREGAAPPVVERNPSGGGSRFYPYPSEPKKKKRRTVIPAPVPEYEVSGPLSRQRTIEHSKLPDYDLDQWTASLKTRQTLEREDRRKRQKKSEAALLLLLLH